MSDRIVDKARGIIKPIVEELGYVFVDLEYKKDYTGYVLALTIDKPEGVNINDCERVSKALDIPLDENDKEIMELLENKKAIVLLNKSDLDTVVDEDSLKEMVNAPVLWISAKTESGIQTLEDTIKELRSLMN